MGTTSTSNSALSITTNKKSEEGFAVNCLGPTCIGFAPKIDDDLINFYVGSTYTHVSN